MHTYKHSAAYLHIVRQSVKNISNTFRPRCPAPSSAILLLTFESLNLSYPIPFHIIVASAFIQYNIANYCNDIQSYFSRALGVV